MSKVYQGEKYNPYGIGCTLYWQWEAEFLDEQLHWYREELMIRVCPCPRVGEAMIGKRYILDDGEINRLHHRVEELRTWIVINHDVVHVQETNCDGVMCLVDEDDLKEILGES